MNAQSPTGASQKLTTTQIRVLCLLVSLGTLLVYSPVRQFEFINFDDPEYVTQNRMVLKGLSTKGLTWAFTSFAASNWHPLTWLSHMAGCEAFGTDPGAHHVINALLHSANAGLLCLLLCRITGALWTSLLAAAMFGLHPLRVESVAWISERKDVLSGLFFFLSLLAYAQYAHSRETAKLGSRTAGGNDKSAARPGRLPYCLSLVLFALGLMAKPMLVTLPFVLLLLDYWPLKRARNFNSWKTLLIEKWAFFLLAAASAFITFQAQRSGGSVVRLEDMPAGFRLGNAICSYAAYLVHTVWPVKLSVIYPLPERLDWYSVAFAAILLSTFSWLTWRVRRSQPHLLTGWLWFMGMLIPVLGLIQVGNQSMADRYTYLPHVGLLLALTFEAKRIANALKLGVAARVVAAAAVLAACAGVSIWQLSFWKNSQKLFARALSVTQRNATAEVNLGLALEESGRVPEALEHYEEALRLKPGLPQVHNNIGNVLSRSGRDDEALFHYRESVRLQPRPLAFLNLGKELAKIGQRQEAGEAFAQAMRLDSSDPGPHRLLGCMELERGNTAGALKYFERARELDPNDVPTLVWLARVRSASPEPGYRNAETAMAFALRATVITDARDPSALDSLAMAYAEAGKYEDAQKTAAAALDRARDTGQLQWVAELRQRLEMYRSSKPFRSAFTNAGKDPL